MTRMIRPAGVALVALAAALPGCGPTQTTVSGKVTHQGKNLVWGSVTLVGADGIFHTGTISPDGGYEIKDVRTGAVKIGVVSNKPRESGAAKRPGGTLGGGGDTGGLAQVKVPDGWFPIPEAAGDPATSGLTGDVRGSPAKLDIEVR